MSQIVNLRQMQVGQQGKIAAVEALGEMNRRIRDMGLIPGTTVSIVGRAPLKDPVALRLSGVTISLRNSEADFIKVDLAGASSSRHLSIHSQQSGIHLVRSRLRGRTIPKLLSRFGPAASVCPLILNTQEQGEEA